MTIAGSDPSGGAGIQADIKTFTAIGVYGSAAITCLTAQNSMGIHSYESVDPSFVKRQIELVLQDQPVTHIKTGMIGTAEIAMAVGGTLVDFPGEIICDPVIRASDGHPLFKDNGLNILYNHLMNKATVLTPNIPELEMLTETDCQNQEKALKAGASLFDRFSALRALVITGGHLAEGHDQITDFLLLRSGKQKRPAIKKTPHPRIKTDNTHGTGCTFASAFGAYHLLTNNYQQAFDKAVSLMDRLMGKSVDLRMGKGKGPLGHHILCKGNPNYL